MIEFIVGYTVIATLWFWYLSATPSVNWKWLVSWTIFMPWSFCLLVVGFIHCGLDTFIKWCKKEV